MLTRRYAVVFVSAALLLACTTAYLFKVQSAYAAADSDRVLRGIPAIARAFAPVGGVKWQDFANVLAGICAVESTCNPNYPHYVNGGVYSQYQGLFQMNVAEVAKAETAMQQMMPQMQAAAASGDEEQKKAFEFVKKAIEDSRKLDIYQRRFHPEYGIILGAAKHIKTNAILARKYPGKPDWQAAGHLTAQFSGITEGKILRGDFGAAITGQVGNANTEAGALAANKVGGVTVADAIADARNQYGKRMLAMMSRMSQVTNGLTTIPTNVDPFQPPSFSSQHGTTPVLDVPYCGVSTLMETGMMKPMVAPPFPMTNPPSTGNIGPYNGNPYTPPTSASSTPTTSVGKSLGMLLVQPKTAKANSTITVSWTSVHMSEEKPCKLFDNDTEFLAQGNEGSKTRPAGPQTGPEKFTLKCTTADGDSFEQSDTVMVQ